MTEIKISSSLEDYLETIYNFLQHSEKVRAVDISRELNVSRASVTEALKKLDEMNLVNYGRYETLSLTENGKNYAVEVLNKHIHIQEFFEKILGASHEESCENACKIEHIISKDILERLIAFTEYTSLHPEKFQEFAEYYKERK